MEKEVWTKQEIKERIGILSKKYYSGYVDKNPNAGIYKFKEALAFMEENSLEEVDFNKFK